ncbi:MAG TPA: hypothetical protein VGP81_12030 [Pyrinomonadaceae bacterium]|jgi:hypothetical protein|nr:hypothetical protein [Pyrinomonadaceae bacterium]
MKRPITLSTLMALIFLLIFPTGVTRAATPPFTTLQPGQFREINQNLQVNIVFVGYHQGAGPRDINEAAFRAGMPHRDRTIDVGPSSYIPSTNESDQVWIGNSFDYNYNIVYANQAFEDAYFNFVPTISIPCRVTVYQQYYNTQHSRSLNITNNICIEANEAEYWLAQNAPTMLGVDTSKDTVFLINWYGRSDFRFHTYLPFGYPDPDPDTGYTAAFYQPNETIAWGGTTPDDEQNGFGSLKRVWFYDLSAGPEWNTANYLLDTAEFGGLHLYIMPPVWEYGNMSAYRPFNDLSGDLAKITRYVALDCLFTKSPISPPALSPPKMPNSIQFDINLYQADPSWSLRDYVKPDRIVSEHAKLRPYNTQSASVTDLRFDNRQAQIYDCGRSEFIKLFADPSYPATSCYGNRGDENDLLLTDFFLYHRDHLNQFIEDDADLEVPIFAYGVPDNQALPLLGIQDDDHYDGTRSSFIYYWLTDSYRQFRGMTGGLIHEAGHFMGMSHTHDGFDYEDFTYHGSFEDPYFFMWTGDESDSVMGYMFLSNNFSQFDRDNMNRYMTAIYINQANKILPAILSNPNVGKIDSDLSSADSDAGAALTAYENMDYLNAATRAKSAYDKVLAAAARINVKIEPEASSADYRRHKPNPAIIDPINGHGNTKLPLSDPQVTGYLPIQ